MLTRYYRLIEGGKYADAYRLRSYRPASGRGSLADFRTSFERYGQYRATVGPASEPEGAAGSLYVEVPVQTYGRLKNGKPFSSVGTVTLKRSNDIPGASAEQRSWRIATN